MSSAPYQIPECDIETQLAIKRSQFIVNVFHTPTVDAAKAAVDQIRERFPDANHHCWAHVAGAPTDGQRYGFSDDGEPSGTAGKPMLAVLNGSGIGEITVVVTRYFGGIKLGTGGLVKAYASSVKQGLAELSTVEKLITSPLCVELSYDWQGIVLNLLNEFRVENIAQEYTASILLSFDVDKRQEKTLIGRISDISAGLLQVKRRDS